MGVEESGVEPWGRLVDGGREGCDRGSIMEGKIDELGCEKE
jgi:hypothetical protein